MKEKALTRFAGFVKKLCAKQMLALLLCVAMLFGTVPTDALAASSEGCVITDVSNPTPSAYTVDIGTELASVGLPANLEITVAEGEDNISVRTEPVAWTGDYNKDAAGEYALTAAFSDDALAFSPMPTVRITVVEADTTQDANDGAQPQERSNGLRGTAGDEQDLTEQNDIDYSAVCKLTPKEAEYASGKSIQFTLNAQYATPGDPDKPQTVTFGIPIPNTTPEVQLPMFYLTGSGEKEGVPMYRLSYNGKTIDLYLVTDDDGERQIEFTLDAGSTVQGVLSMILPNGVSDDIPAFTLTPTILSEGDYGTNKLLDGGTTAVVAQFGWNNVKKSGNTDNIGVIGAATKDPDRITYTITADSQSSGLATGRIFTEYYTLTDTIDLFGLNYADGDLTYSEENGISTFFVGGAPVLEIAAPLSALDVAKQAAGGLIDKFTIEYYVYNPTIVNTDGTAVELSNLNLHVSLLLSAMRLNPGTEETKVANTAKFDAYSPFGDIHSSIASHTAYTQDRYGIEKTVYVDEACTIPATQVTNEQEVWYKIVAKNNSAGTGPFSIVDELPAGMTFLSAVPDAPTQSGQTLTWGGLSIQSEGTQTIVVKAKFDEAGFVSNPVQNTVALFKGGQQLASDYADVRYLSGIVEDANIIYEKSVDKQSAGADDTLRYTITARNQDPSTAAKLITITDKWPGANVRPTAVIGCSDYELLDAAGASYTLEEVQNAVTPIEIRTIKLYNVPVPKGGGKVTVSIDGIVTKPIAELKNAIVGSEGQNLVETYSVGVGITKDAYSYDSTDGIGAVLRNIDAVAANQVVCYQMKVKNLTDSAINDLVLIDKLPAGLAPVSGTVHGVSGQAVIKRADNSYTSMTLSPVTPGTAYTPHTTTAFNLAANETAIIYLFAEVSETAIMNSKSNGDCITNAAYVGLPGGLVTGDATANIYTYVDTEQAVYIKKTIAFIADYDEDLTNATTRLFKRENNSAQWNKNDIVWGGAYVGYRVELVNRNSTGANKEPVRVYELIDALPQGMEFVGVCVNGDSKAYTMTGKLTELDGLGTQLIRDGETGTWSNSQYTAQALTCRYDKAANKVHITFNQDSSGVLSVKYHQNGADTNLKPYIYLVARVEEDSKQVLYRNSVAAKVDENVKLNNLGGAVSIEDGSGENAGYNLISYYCDVSPMVFKPGIAKKLIGHYFPKDSTTPETVQNEDNLFPGESLRFQIQVGTGVISGSVANRVHASLQDFVVTDILPAEYVYRPKSATVTLNEQLDTRDNTISEGTFLKTLPRGSIEPSVEMLDDGRTKLTWNFNGLDRRLLVSLNNYSFNYFVHLITYDADWNHEYVETYGNYINQATVTHSEEFTSVYSGTPDYDERTITASTVVNVFGAAGTAAVKSVTNEDNKTACGRDPNPCVSVDGAGKRVTYTLQVTNSTNNKTKALVIIDELPRVKNDTGVVNRIGRGSEFSVFFDDAPDVSVYKVVGNSQTPVSGDDYTVRYGDSVGGLNANGDWSENDKGGRIDWGKSSDGKNAVRIAFDPEYSLASGETVLVSFSAIAGSDADPSEIAWNSFGYSYKSLARGELSEKIYAEPQRVGISVPGAEISVAKTVTGDTAPSGTLFTFLLRQNDTPCVGVKYTLSGDSAVYRTGVDGSFALKASQTATLFTEPGSGYSVTETALPDDFTLTDMKGAANGDGTYDAETFTFKTLTKGDSAGVVCTNDYAVPATRDLTVSKLWRGQTNPNQPTSIAVQLYKDGAAEGDPVALNEGNSWQHTWTDLSTSERWTVDELGTMPGYTKSITGDSANGFVITNTYSPSPLVTAEIQAQKAVDGDIDPPEETYSFRLTAVSYTAPAGYADMMTARQMPMPVGSVNGTKTARRTGEGSVAFGKLVFAKAGTYVYTIRENSGTNALCKYDDSVYTLTYTVADVGGRLAYTLGVTKPGSDANPAVVFTNTYAWPVGLLTVSKRVTGGSPNALFTFRFTFSEATRFEYVKSDATTGTIATGESLRLKHGESVTITIPQGVTYAVVEDSYANYTPTPADRTYTGTISAAPSRADYTNSYHSPYVPPVPSTDSDLVTLPDSTLPLSGGDKQTGSLTVKKTVTGDLGGRSREFAFKIVFDAPESYYYTGSKTGTIASGDTVLLGHGEYITIINLPAGTDYSVTESGNSDYCVSSSGDTGIIAANSDSVAAFVNSRDKVPITGDDSSFFKGVTLMLAALVGAAALWIVDLRRKRRRRSAKTSS